MTSTPPSSDDTQPSGSHRGTHRAPAKPQRMIGLSLIAVAAVVALLVAFSSCGGGFDSGAGVINGTPGQTSAATSTPTPSAAPTPTPAATTAAPTPTPATPATTAPATTRPPTTAPAATAPATTAPPVARIPVVVLNGTTTAGLAARGAERVKAAGWRVSAIGNWRSTTVSTTTIFYASGDQAAAQRLARELSGDQAVRPALSGMSTSNLTLVVG